MLGSCFSGKGIGGLAWFVLVCGFNVLGYVLEMSEVLSGLESSALSHLVHFEFGDRGCCQIGKVLLSVLRTRGCGQASKPSPVLKPDLRSCRAAYQQRYPQLSSTAS